VKDPGSRRRILNRLLAWRRRHRRKGFQEGGSNNEEEATKAGAVTIKGKAKEGGAVGKEVEFYNNQFLSRTANCPLRSAQAFKSGKARKYVWEVDRYQFVYFLLKCEQCLLHRIPPSYYR
jgi:hypothetical protein